MKRLSVPPVIDLAPANVPWRVVAFDLDDTLYPEMDFVRSGFREVAIWSRDKLECDSDSALEEFLLLFDRGDRRFVFDAWVANHHFPTHLIQEMVQVYRDHFPRIEPFDGVRQMLSKLEHSFRLGLISDGPLAIQERKLEALGIRDKFEAVIFTDKFGRDFWKPSTRPFLALAEAMTVDPTEIVYVGDNPAKDFVACRQLGMKSIWFRQQAGVYSHLEPGSDEAKPDFVVDSIAGVWSLLTTTQV